MVKISETPTTVLHRELGKPPTVATRAHGLVIVLEDGREVLDGSSGPAASCLGHCHPRVVAAVCEQARQLDYAHTASFSNRPAEDLAINMVESGNGAFARALFVSSGSEALEVSIKIARQYFVESGEPERTHVISRKQSYHGATLTALALGGHVSRRKIYEPMLSSSFSQVSPCFAYHYQADDETDDAYVARLALELETEIQRIGPERVMAFCAETVVGATAGCVPPVPGYFSAIRSVCDKYGILLILDEVMCGLGRTGTMHGWEPEGVRPDIQTVAKGLTGGYQPLGGVLVAQRVVDKMMRGSGLLAHGQTWQCHPVACAAALEVQRVIAEERLLDNVRTMGELLEQRLKTAFLEHEFVGDVRGRGLFWALEFVADKDERAPFPAHCRISDRLRHHALEAGLAIYPSSGTVDGRVGDHVIIAPPFIVTAADVEEIIERLQVGVEKTFHEVDTASLGKAARIQTKQRPLLS